MAIQTERKHLVVNNAWRAAAGLCRAIRTGYLSRTSCGTVKVKRCATHATLTVKSPPRGVSRDAFTYPIPLADADYMLHHLCVAPVIQKVRHEVHHAGMAWNVDVYGGAASGLVLAELDLRGPDQPYLVPEWAGKEVTHDLRFRNWAIALGAWQTSLETFVSVQESVFADLLYIEPRSFEPRDRPHSAS